MKRPQPDIGDTLRAGFIGSLGGCRKFKRLWGTEQVGGVEVLTRKKNYYPDNKRLKKFVRLKQLERLKGLGKLKEPEESAELEELEQLLSPQEREDLETLERLFKFLGVYEDVKDSEPKGVKRAWFYLNKNKGPGNREEDSTTPFVSNAFIADNLNRMWWDDNDGQRPENLTLTTSITIDADINTSAISDKIDLNASKQQKMQAVIDNYEALWSTCPIEQQGVGVINKGFIYDSVYNVEVPDEDDLAPEDPWMATIARYALLDDGIPCTIKDLEIGISQKVRNKVNTLVLTLEIPYTAFYPNSQIVDRIAQDLTKRVALEQASIRHRQIQKQNYLKATTNGYVTYMTLRSMAFNSVDDDLEEGVLTRDYLLWEDEALQDAVYEALWVTHEGKWYLRADVFDDPKAYGITYKKLHTYIFSILDTGYKKKKAKWYNKVIAVIVFIVAAVVTYISSGLTSPLLKAATALVVAAFALSIAALAFSALGMESMAMAFSEVNKSVAPLVTVASVILIVNSILTFAQQALKQGATEALKAVATDTIAEISKGLTDLAAGNVVSAAAMKVMAATVKAYTLPQQIQLEKLADRNKDLKAEYDKFMEENSRESDVLQGFMRIYSSPATGDWSWYSSLYDVPYERGGGLMAMGNIQKTTKQALRKADYDMPVFESIRFV